MLFTWPHNLAPIVISHLSHSCPNKSKKGASNTFKAPKQELLGKLEENNVYAGPRVQDRC